MARAAAGGGERLRRPGSGIMSSMMGDDGAANAEATAEALANRRSLIRTRGAFLAGLPSDERSETAGIVWENAMLRAKVHAGKQALLQLSRQLGDRTARADGSVGARYRPLLDALGERAAALVAEQTEALEKLSAWGGRMSDSAEVEGGETREGAGGKASDKDGAAGGTSGGRFRYLAQLVPTMMRHSQAAFATVLRESRELTKRHRAEREALCVELKIAPTTSATSASQSEAAASDWDRTKVETSLGVARLHHLLLLLLLRLSSTGRWKSRGAGDADG